MRGFLGLTGYYRRFIKDYAQVAVSLMVLTRKSLPDRVKWTPACEAAIVTHQSLTSAASAASNRSIGAVLSQMAEDVQDRLIAYYSRKLLPREVKYSTVEKESFSSDKTWN